MTNESDNNPRAAKWRNRAFNVLLFCVCVAIVLGIRAWQKRDTVSGQAPALQGITLAGQNYSLPAHPGHPVLVHFWATWCPVCRAEQGSIAAIAHDNPNVITVAMQSGKSEEIAKYMKEQGVDFPVVNDADGNLSSAWGITGVPASFIIAPDGQIRYVEVGYTTGIGLRLRLWLAGR
ncbi:MAG: protein disulfide oxidoreductase [Gallionella sp.]|nr:protein disulfide oxidoreductase [Gallionella sp.]